MIAGLKDDGLSMDEIARRAKVSRATVYRLGSGEARAPAYETVTRIKSLVESVRVSPLRQK